MSSEKTTSGKPDSGPEASASRTSVNLGQVAMSLERTVARLKDDSRLEGRDVNAYLRALGSILRRVCLDLEAAQPSRIISEELPGITTELEVVTKEVFGATEKILESAEVIDQNAGENAAVADAVMQIFEACSFQDITGQRITKITSALRSVETRARATSAAVDEGIDADLRRDLEALDRVKQGDAALLEGPQTSGGSSQDDIDALLAEMDAGPSTG